MIHVSKSKKRVVFQVVNKAGWVCDLFTSAESTLELSEGQSWVFAWPSTSSEVESFSFSGERTVFVGYWIDSADETLIFDFDERDQRVNTA